jgi:endonuclease YncB( thermonuclease family)
VKRGPAAAATAAVAALTWQLLLTATPAAAAVNVLGTVVYVVDGDTLDVDIDGDSTTTPIRIRNIGINTMELTVHSRDLSRIAGECHSSEATRKLHALVYGKVVRVTARYASSMSGTRYRRSVDVMINGVWRDVHWMLMRQGHGLFLGNLVEYRKNWSYLAAAQAAQRAGRNLWDPDYCGVGPAANLTVSVKYDAVGKDASNLNGEYLRVVNHGSSDVSLAGWHVRDGSPVRYYFPEGARVSPGKTVHVHVGQGNNTSTDFFWGRTAPVFNNPTGSPTYNGDGGYLFDPEGNLRASQMWPAR